MTNKDNQANNFERHFYKGYEITPIKVGCDPCTGLQVCIDGKVGIPCYNFSYKEVLEYTKGVVDNMEAGIK